MLQDITTLKALDKRTTPLSKTEWSKCGKTRGHTKTSRSGHTQRSTTQHHTRSNGTRIRDYHSIIQIGIKTANPHTQMHTYIHTRSPRNSLVGPLERLRQAVGHDLPPRPHVQGRKRRALYELFRGPPPLRPVKVPAINQKATKMMVCMCVRSAGQVLKWI